MIRGVDMVVLTVDDQDRALEFWTEKAGFTVGTDAGLALLQWTDRDLVMSVHGEEEARCPRLTDAVCYAA